MDFEYSDILFFLLQLIVGIFIERLAPEELDLLFICAIGFTMLFSMLFFLNDQFDERVVIIAVGIVLLILFGVAFYFNRNSALVSTPPVVVSTAEPPVSVVTATPVSVATSAAQSLLRQRDGVPVIWHPGGCYTAGLSGEDKRRICSQLSCAENQVWEDRLYEPDVCVAPFSIEQYEVSVHLYQETGIGAFVQDSRPQVNLTWPQARQFCQRRGGDLPGENQWEFAARGTLPPSDAHLFMNVSNVPERQTAFDVTDPRLTRSWSGVIGLNDNVREWVISAQPLSHTDFRLARGASFRITTLLDYRLTHQHVELLDETDDDLGFRCVFAG